MAQKYKILGVEGEEVQIGDAMYPAGVGHVVELEDEVAESALSESKIELVSDEAAEEAPAEEEEASEEADSDETPE